MDTCQAQRCDGTGALSPSAVAAFECALGVILSARRAGAGTHVLLTQLLESMPAFVSVLMQHRPRSLYGRSLLEVMDIGPRQPARLAKLYREWGASPSKMYRAPPTLVFAVIGQARADGGINAEDRSALLSKLLTYWALRATVNTTELCAAVPVMRKAAA